MNQTTQAWAELQRPIKEIRARYLAGRLGWRPSARVQVVGDRPYCPQLPTPKQAEFLALTCFEALYGGAAGPGKTSALLMGALQHVEVPGYAALLLRRSFSDLSLPGALMDRAGEWLRPTAACWKDQTKTWEFPSGATLTFGYLENEKDKYRYQGAEIQYLAFDELTQFSETQYRFLLSRLRRPSAGPLASVPLSARAASNPGGLGHEWVKSYFVEAPPESGRVFIPARLEDNPHLDTEEYDAALARLDPVTRRQLRLGDWEAVAQGNLFRREWFFPELSARPVAGTWVRYWDLAGTQDGGDWSVGTLMGRQPDNSYVIASVKREQLGPRPLESLIRATAEEDGRAVAVVIEQEPGSAGVILIDHYRRNVLAGFNVRGVRSTGDKLERARPLSAQAEGRNIRVVRGAVPDGWYDRLESFPTVGVPDDEIDSASGALAFLAPTGYRPRTTLGPARSA